MSLSDKDVKRLAQATAEQSKLNTELESTENYKKRIADYTAEQLQAEQSLYQTNSQNSLMVAEMLARTGKLAEADKMRQQATEEHLKFVAAVESQALTMRNQELAVKEAIKAVEDAQAEGNPEKIKVAQAQLTTAQAQLEVHKERLKVLDQEKKAVETRLGNLEKQTEEYSKLTEMGKEMYKETKEGLGAMAELFGGIVDYQKTGIGRAMIYVQKLRQGQGALAGIKAGLKDVFNPANIGAMLFTKVAQSMVMMLLKVDSMGAEFAKATGTGREYVGMIEDVVRTGNNVGVSFEDASNSIKGLYNEMIGFTMLSKDTQKSIANQVAGFETLGIKMEDVADIMNTFSKTMGTSANESIALTRNLAMMGSTIGISSQDMIKNFQNANKTLAVYGKDSIKVFTNLSAAAKAAGVEMEDLLGIAGKFDTFEDAADSVGKLNAILGSQMSSTKMLMMTEDERIETLIMQINASGQSFAQMDRFKQKAIANAAGIQDMAKANRLFGMSMSQYRQYGKEMKDAETSQKKMEAS